MDTEHLNMVTNISTELNIPVDIVVNVIKGWNETFREELKASTRDKNLPDKFRLMFPNLLSFYSAKGLYKIKKERKIARINAKSTL